MSRPQITKPDFDKLTDALAFRAMCAVIDYQMYENLMKAAEENEIVVNQSRVFWKMTIDAHLNSAVLRLCRVYDQQRSSMNLSKWLRLLKHNPNWLRDSADPTQLERDMEYVSEQNLKVKNLTTYRGNVVAHLGENYVLDLRNTRQSFKLTYGDLKELLENGLKIVNRYGTVYKGHSWSRNMAGEDDYQFIFRELKKTVEKYRAEQEAEIQKESIIAKSTMKPF